jgi:hypothetical protein
MISKNTTSFHEYQFATPSKFLHKPLLDVLEKYRCLVGAVVEKRREGGGPQNG